MEITNEAFANNDRVFRKACELAGIQPTKRQASKYKNKKGLAYLFKDKAKREVK